MGWKCLYSYLGKLLAISIGLIKSEILTLRAAHHRTAEKKILSVSHHRTVASESFMELSIEISYLL